MSQLPFLQIYFFNRHCFNLFGKRNLDGNDCYAFLIYSFLYYQNISDWFCPPPPPLDYRLRHRIFRHCLRLHPLSLSPFTSFVPTTISGTVLHHCLYLHPPSLSLFTSSVATTVSVTVFVYVLRHYLLFRPPSQPPLPSSVTVCVYVLRYCLCFPLPSQSLSSATISVYVLCYCLCFRLPSQPSSSATVFVYVLRHCLCIRPPSQPLFVHHCLHLQLLSTIFKEIHHCERKSLIFEKKETMENVWKKDYRAILSFCIY